MLDFIFVITLIICFGFTFFFVYWCDKQIDKKTEG